jgi:asparagine synthase (glutamine-hydrolysing)
MDIASMASALEVRVPYLDHHLVEFAMNLPLEMKVQAGEQKYLMKKTLEKYLPKELIYRQKWGFPAPVGEWLKTDLAYLIDKYLNPADIKRQGLFDPNMVQRFVKLFKQGKDYHYKRVWALIVFQMWYANYIE